MYFWRDTELSTSKDVVVRGIAWKHFWNHFLFPSHVEEVGYPEHIKKQLLPLRKSENHYHTNRSFKLKYMGSYARKRNCESDILNKPIWCIEWVRAVLSNKIAFHTGKNHSPLCTQMRELLLCESWLPAWGSDRTNILSTFETFLECGSGHAGWRQLVKGLPDMGADLVRNNIQGTWKKIFSRYPHNSGELCLKQDAYSVLNKLIWRDWGTYKK